MTVKFTKEELQTLLKQHLEKMFPEGMEFDVCVYHDENGEIVGEGQMAEPEE